MADCPLTVKRLVIAQIPLRQLCDFHRNFPTWKVTDTNHESLPHKSRRRLSWFVSRTFVICVRDKVRELCCQFSPCIVTGKIPLERHKRVCHRLCRKHLDMSRLFLSATFMICVRDFYWNFMVSWLVTVWVRDFNDLCPWLSPWGSFGESRHNGIWAYITSHQGQLDLCFYHGR